MLLVSNHLLSWFRTTYATNQLVDIFVTSIASQRNGQCLGKVLCHVNVDNKNLNS